MVLFCKWAICVSCLLVASHQLRRSRLLDFSGYCYLNGYPNLRLLEEVFCWAEMFVSIYVSTEVFEEVLSPPFQVRYSSATWSCPRYFQSSWCSFALLTGNEQQVAAGLWTSRASLELQQSLERLTGLSSALKSLSGARDARGTLYRSRHCDHLPSTSSMTQSPHLSSARSCQYFDCSVAAGFAGLSSSLEPAAFDSSSCFVSHPETCTDTLSNASHSSQSSQCLARHCGSECQLNSSLRPMR